MQLNTWVNTQASSEMIPRKKPRHQNNGIAALLVKQDDKHNHIFQLNKDIKDLKKRSYSALTSNTKSTPLSGRKLGHYNRVN